MKSKLVYISAEERQMVIKWINEQDIFRAKTLFEHFQIVDEKKKHCVRDVINTAKRIGYLQTLEKGRYITLSEIPIDIRVNIHTKWQQPKI